MLRISQLVEVKRRVDLIQEDPADDRFLECSLDGRADYVVSGDDHLLKIGRYQRIRIPSVRQFFKLLEEPESISLP